MRFKSNNIFRLLLIISLLLTMAVPAWAATSGSVAISASSDDAEELSGIVDIDFVDYPLGDFIAGMRFSSVPIPPNATILNAYISFTASFNNSDATSLTFVVQDADDPPSFQAGAGGDISGRSTTGVPVPWNIPAVAWTIGDPYPSPELSSLLQAIVDRGGWSSGNAMVFITTIGSGTRFAFAEDDPFGNPPELHFTYNVPPVADPESFTVLQGGTATEADLDAGADLLDGDTDADGDPLTVNTTPVSGPAYASSFTLNDDGTFSYTHDGTANFTDSFDYEVIDDSGATDTGTVTITITPVNNPPVADDETFTVLEGGTATEADLDAGADLLDGDTDADGDTLTVNTTPVSGPTNGALILNTDGTFSYTHDNSENLTDSFEYEVSDGNGGTDTGTVTITITPVNDNAPVAGDDTADAVDEGGTVTTVDTGQTSVLHDDTDADMPGDTLTAVLDTGPSYAASFTLNGDGTFSYTHDNSENFIDSFTYHVNDGVNDGNVATVTITINPVNDNLPVSGDDTADALDEGGSVTTVDGGQTSVLHDDTDADLPGDTLTAVLDTGPSYAASFALNGDGTFSYTHDNSENFTDSFTYHVNDGVNDGNVATVTITINPVNDNVPVSGDDTADSLDEGGSVTTVDGGQTSVLHDDTDADMPGDTLTAVLDTGPSYAASFALNGDGTFSYTHDNSENLTDSFTYHVNDGVNDGNVATVTITINPVNDNVPVSGDDTADSLDEGGSVTTVDGGQTSVLHDDTDADMPGDTLTAVLDTGPSYAASFALNGDGTFSYTHDNSENFTDSFTYHVNDGVNDGNVATVTITINPVNDNLPVSGDDTADAVDEGGSVTTVDGGQTSVLHDDTDADMPGDTLTAVLDTGPSYAASFALNGDGTFSYTHDNSENLTDSFTYHVNDGVNDGNVATVTITINPVNDNVPVSGDDTADSLDEGGSVTTVDGGQTSVLHDDTDADMPGDTLTAVLDTGPSYAASFALNGDGTFSYTHDNSENFTDSFTYHVNDGVNDGNVATVTITINPVNDNLPVSGDDTADAVDEGGSVTTVDGGQTSVLHDDTDADMPGDTLTAVLDTGPSYAASFALNGDGSFSYTHDNSENFTDSFTYHVNDGVNDGNVATVTITINPVNDNLPVSGDDTADALDEGGSVTTVDGGQTSVLHDDTDADLPGDTLTAVLDTGPSYASSFALNGDGSFSYTHDNSENFTDSFTYHVNDGVNDGNVATVTITINPVNDNLPVSGDDTADAVDEGGSVTTVDGGQTSVLHDDTDADLPGDTLTAVLDTGPSYAASFALNGDGTFSYTHDNSENFTDSFTYHVNDGVNDGNVATVTITINPVNDNLPVSGDDTADALDEGGSVTTVDGGQTSVLHDDTDADLPGDTLTAVLDTGPSYAASFALNGDGTFNYTHDNSENLTDSFTYHVNDGVNDGNVATVTITINPVNDNLPVSGDDTADAVDEGGSVTTVDGGQTSVLHDDTDADLPGDTLTAVLDTGPSYAASFALNGDGTFSYTHDNSENFTDSFTYHVNDGVNDGNVATVTITINPVNDNLPVSGDDTADAVDEGGSVTTVDGGQTSVLHDDTDADLPGDTLTAVLDTGPSYAASFVLNGDGTFSYTHDNSENFTDSFTYHVNDGVNDGNVATVTITINPVNDNLPVSGDDTADALDEGGSVTTVDGGQTSVLHDDTDADLPGDTLTAVLDTGPSYAASFALNGDGTFSYTHDNSENFTDSFTYHVNDGVNDGNVATVTITINPVNDNLPVSGDDTADALDEGGSVTTVDGGQTSVLHDDTDADLPGDTLTAVLDTGPSYAASFALNGDGTFSYTHDNSENFTDSFTYHVNDGVNDGNVATVTITINPVNDNLPVSGDDTADALDEGGSVTTVDGGQTSVLHDDTDADLPGDTLTAVLDTGPSYAASFALNGDGTFSYTHDNSENFTDSFTYHVNDGVNDGNVATVTITINPVNDNLPVSGDDTADALDEGGSVSTVDGSQSSVLHDDTDADLPGDTLTAVLDTGPSYAASFVLNGDGTFSYSHDDSENLTDSFTYHVNDGVNDGNVATVTITMTPVNDNNPVANDDTVDYVAEGGTVTTVDTGQTSVLHDDTDADMPGDTLTAVLDSSPIYAASFTLNADGTFSYTHDGTENFLDSFTYHVNDGVNDSNIATVTIIIDVVNDPPAFDSDPWAFSVDENALGAAAGTVTATDPENNGLTYSISGADSASFLIDGLSGVITTAVALDFETDSSYSFTVTVIDDGVGPPNLTDTATVNVTVNDVNEAPVGVDDAGATDEDTVLNVAAGSGGVLDNDTDVDAGATLSVSGFDSASANGASVTVNADGSYTYDPTVSATLQALPALATTTDTFNYTVSDGSLTDTATVTITVSGLNDAPVAADDTNTTDEDTVLNITALADRVLANDSDVDAGDTFTVTSFDATSTNGAAVTVSPNGSYDYDPTVSATLQALAVGESIGDTFTYTITDSQSATDTATVTITVTGVNDGPVANDDPLLSTDEDTAATFLILANDSDVDTSDTLTVDSLDTTGTVGLVTNNILNVTYDPNGQFDYLAVGESATDTFTYTVSDGNGGTDTATVTVTITGVNDAPVAVDDTGATDEDTLLIIAAPGVLSNDTDVDTTDTLAVSVYDATSANGAAVTVNADGSYTYDPTVSATLQALAVTESINDTFTYTITDSQSATDTATVTITVTGVNDAPTAAADSETASEDGPAVLIDLTVNDTDPDTSDDLEIQSVDTTGTLGIVTIEADNDTVTYDPNGQFEALAAGQNTTDTFSYIVLDGNGGTDTATVTVTITGVNDAPTANDDSVTTDEDTITSTPAPGVLSNDTDVDTTDTLTVTTTGTVTTAQGAIATLNADGSASYDPNGQFEYLAVGESTTDSIDYSISDGNGGTDTATVTVTITGVNDTPTAVADSDTTSEDGPAVLIDLTVNDTDPDTSDDLEIQSVDTTGTLGSVTIEADNDTVTYDPNGQFEALSAGDTMNDTFSYTVSDGNGGTDTATVTVTITGVNDGPVAGFSGTPTSGTEPLTVTFTDSSTDPDADGIVSWDWDFGDGGNSAAPSPIYIYTQSGTNPSSNSYTVTLTVTDAQGITDTYTLNNYITVTDTDPTAGFINDPDPPNGNEPLSVEFDDTTVSYDGVSWSWDFGDGNTSAEQDPTHIYDQNGTYSVTLSVAEADGDTDITSATLVTVYETGPTANFSADEISGDEPLAVTFTDSSTSHDGIITWDWDYGDGSPHGTIQNPTYTFLQDGSYTVILTVYEDAADGSLISDAHQVTILVNDTGPTADFDPSPSSSGTIPLLITFEDTSDAHDGVVSWIWDFDNGGSTTDSFEQNPTFTFNQAGTFNVCLTVEDPDGDSDTSCAIITALVPGVDTDADGDGWWISQGDCNDNDASINPGSFDICGDGIDQDCFDGDRVCPPVGEGCCEISNDPLDVKLDVASPNIMFVLDDSGSMDWEFMTTDNDGLYSGNYYLYDMSDNLYNYNELSSTERTIWKTQWSGYNQIYYNPDVQYEPWYGDSNANTNTPRSHPRDATPTLDLNDIYFTISGITGIIVDDQDSGDFTTTGNWANRTSSNAYNTNWQYARNNGTYTAEWTPPVLPAGDYEVWVWYVDNWRRSNSVAYSINHSGGPTTSTVNQRQNGDDWFQLVSDDGVTDTFYFDGSSGSVSLSFTVSGNTTRVSADAVIFVPVGTRPPDVINAHYFVWSDSQNRAYLVNLDGAIKYYEVTAVGDTVTELLEKTGTDIPADIVTGRIYDDERQNFANWFQFYRKRWLTSIAAVSRVIPNLEGVYVGWRSINGDYVEPVQPVNVDGETDRSGYLVGELKSYHQDDHSSHGTPLRRGLNYVGLYYHMTETSAGLETELQTSPISTADGGECQQNFAIVMTDGYWNGGSPGVGNADLDDGQPYADSYSDTLADVAMYYYENDLAPGVGNEVPTNFFDKANWQHMVTYGITFGVNGTLDPDNYDLYNVNVPDRVYPTWPDPDGGNDRAKVDDVWHAAVDGRGRYLSAKNPEELIGYLESIVSNIVSRIGSGSSVSVNGEEVDAGLVIYQALYNTDGWIGDVRAHRIDTTTGNVIRDSYIWSAEEELYSQSWDTGRLIATYDGNQGQQFRYNDLNSGQQSSLDSNATTAENMVNYLRGDDSNEQKNGGSFRDRIFKYPDETTRSSKLGDIVHSSPVYQKYINATTGAEYGLIFVGANDGMLHAFDADLGYERFAYVPNLVFENLKDYTQPAYNHKYYVNVSPYVKNAGGTALLVGGLGKGGKGYFCLDVSDPSSIVSESDVADMVQWEFPNSSTSNTDVLDMGYSFSRAFIVKSNYSGYPWLVVFGNGYSSPNEHAVLFIVDAFTGDLVKKIDTGVGGGGICNGLSTPVVIDVDNNQTADYLYAGDLMGNMWKFDISDPSPTNWDVAYKNSVSGNPEPLFTAKDDSGNVQPITSKPDVMRPCSPDLPGYFVIFGTGKYLGYTDFSTTGTQTIYGISDYGDDDDNTEYLGAFNRGSTPQLSNQPDTVTLLEQTEIFWGNQYTYVDEFGATVTVTLPTYVRVLSDNAITYETMADPDGGGEYPDFSNTVPSHAGWYFDFPITKERMIRDLLIRSGKVIFISSIPTSTACSAGGESILHESNACSGGRLATPQLDINNDGVIDESDLINIGGEWMAPTGMYFPTMLYPPSIVPAGEDEIKLMSTSSGQIIDVRETAERAGMFYWLQLDQ